MRSIQLIAAIASASFATNCGLSPPPIDDFGDINAEAVMIQSISHNVVCEVRDALSVIYKDRDHTYLDDWGVQILLNFTIIDSSKLSPSVDWTPKSIPTSIFSLAANTSISSDATRTDKLNSFYTIKELKNKGKCSLEARPGGLMLMQNDLKLTDWLLATTTVQETKQANFNNPALTKDVIFHEIKFDVKSSGGITPSWKLTRATINTGDFFFASRDRSHDLQITLGPTDQKDPGPGTRVARRPGPGFAASGIALSGDIGVSVGNAVRQALTR